MQLDLEFVRAHFPALSSGFIYMDNAGGSQTLKDVVDRIADYLLSTDVQLGASYEISRRAGERVAEGTRVMAEFVNANHPDEVVMGSATSSLLKNLSICLMKTWKAGDEVIVTNSDHEANISPWTALGASGIVVKTWSVNPETLRLEIADLERLLTPRTRLVTVSHVSNILGTLNPIAEIAGVVHAHGAQICVDGVAYAPHRPIDVQALDVDFYAFSFYKVYGPHYALLYGKKDLLEALPGLNHYFIESTPYKFQPGNVNFEFCHAMGAVPEYLKRLTHHHYPNFNGTPRAAIEKAFALVAQHEEKLSQHLLDFLKRAQGVTVIGEPTADKAVRVPTLSFVVKGRNSETLPLACDPHGIGIRFGDFYAKKLIDSLNLSQQGGVVRVSLVHYNTLEEVDRLIEVLSPLLL